MDNQTTLVTVNKIFQMVFDQPNHLNLDELFQKLATDMRLPYPVQDTITGNTTWSISEKSQNFITSQNVPNLHQNKDWNKPNCSISDISDISEILKIWSEINLISTERYFDSINVAKSDSIYTCKNVYRSADCHSCSNIIYTEGCANSEYLLASARSANCNFCIKTDDSSNCSNSYHIICSSKIINSLFVQDCYDLYECMFCAHISSRKYCVANMKLGQLEYYKLKPLVIDYILRSFNNLT